MAADNPALFSATLQLSAFDLEAMQGNKGTQRSKLLLNKECKSAKELPQRSEPDIDQPHFSQVSACLDSVLKIHYWESVTRPSALFSF